VPDSRKKETDQERLERLDAEFCRELEELEAEVQRKKAGQ
tara:strand:- start:223 stop:342 length:120 start_codon:yes stop_codon:yes gene_type:complete